MIDLTKTYSNTATISPYLRTFLQTFQVGIRNREAKSSALHNIMVTALDASRAADIAYTIIEPYDMIVKDVIAPGDEMYGLAAGIDADPITKANYDGMSL